MIISELYSLFCKHPIISIDSRNCPKESIFFALKGDNFNANAFAASALQNGAAYAVIDEEEYALSDKYILVDDALTCLQDLARYHRDTLGTTVIGITGTNGKTTTKELIAAVLSQKFNIHFTKGNLNNHIGVPLTLLQLTSEHELAVIEMWANHQGEIKMLTEIAHPDFGIITNVGKAHLEGFGSFEGVMKTKAELYDYILANGKSIFINNDNGFLKEMASKAGFQNSERLISYSLNNHSNYVNGSIISCSPFLELNCKLKTENSIDIKSNLIGAYNAENVLAAATIGFYFGLSAEMIKTGIEKYIPQNNRSQLTVTELNKLVVDAYNANPTSMKAAVMNFAQMQVTNKMLILGDMLELGEQSADEHQSIVNLLTENELKNVILVGKQFSMTQNNFECFNVVDELINYLSDKKIADYYILIKGSRGIKLEKVITYL